VASTGELSRAVDAIQSEAQEGPGLDAFVGHHVFRSDDLATDPRRPVFGRLTADRTEVMSMTSHRLTSTTKRTRTSGSRWSATATSVPPWAS
jgi:hypothetical protein